jgi:hypothetical protein
MNTYRKGFINQPTAHIRYQYIQTSDEYEEWLSALHPHIQAFISIRPVGRGSMEYLKSVVQDFASIYESSHKAPLSFVATYESYPFPNVHLHVCCGYPLDFDFVRKILRSYKVDSKVLPYNRNGNSLLYTFKEANFSDTFEWDFRNLDFYLKSPSTSRERRWARRQQERQAKAS